MTPDVPRPGGGVLPFPTPFPSPGIAEVPAPDGPQARELDRIAMEERGIPSPVLMENAGRAAAEVVQAAFPRGSLAVLVGGGNNGGDGLVLARTLAAWGRDVTVVQCATPPPGIRLLHGWDSVLPSIPASTPSGEVDPRLLPSLERSSVVVDAILGTGASPPPREPLATVLRTVDEVRRGRGVVALDLPSGVDPTTGAVPGASIQAALTVAFGWPKLGTLQSSGAQRAGERVVVEIGFPPDVARGRVTGAPSTGEPARVFTTGWARSHLPPPRGGDDHKRSVGSLLLLAGSPGMAGAALLGARAALRAGVGLLTVAAPPALRDALQTGVPEALFVDREDPRALGEAVAGASAIALGPGMGVESGGASAVRAVLEHPALEPGGGPPLLLDADALTHLTAFGDGGRDLLLRRAGKVLLTPHPGEMARLLGTSSSAVQGDRWGALAAAVEEWGSTVLLKGNPTLVAPPGGPVHLAPTGGSHLAVGGMGDVLTGVAAALLAQGCPPLAAAGVALVATGAAARQAGALPGLLPGDLPLHLPAVLDTLRHPQPLPFPFVTLHLPAS